MTHFGKKCRNCEHPWQDHDELGCMFGRQGAVRTCHCIGFVAEISPEDLATQSQEIQDHCATIGLAKGWSPEEAWKKCQRAAEIFMMPLEEGVYFLLEAIKLESPEEPHE